MRRAGLAIAAIAALGSACAMIAGLDDYSGPPADGGEGEEAASDAPGETMGRDDSGPDVAPCVARSAGYREIVVADHPIAYWRLGDTSASGPCNNEIDAPYFAAYQASPAPDAAGLFCVPPAVEFSLSSSVTVAVGQGGVALDFPHHAPFTYEAWVKLDPGLDGGTGGVFGTLSGSFKPADSGLGYLDDGTTCYVTSDFGVRCERWARSQIVGVFKAPPGAVPPAVFAHVVFTSDGMNQFLYVDGSKVLDQLGADADQAENMRPLTFGGIPGTLAELAVYDYPLAEAAIVTHYQAGRSR